MLRGWRVAKIEISQSTRPDSGCIEWLMDRGDIRLGLGNFGKQPCTLLGRKAFPLKAVEGKWYLC